MILRRFLCGLISAAGILVMPGNSMAASNFSIATNPAVLQVGGGLATDGTNFLLGFVAGTNVAIQIISPSGALPGQSVNIGKTGSAAPAGTVCFGRTNFLGVWSDSTAYPGVDMFGQFISPAGAKTGATFPLLASQGGHGFQAVRAAAFDGANSLVVWQDTNSMSLYGSFVTQSGGLSGGPFLISSQSQIGGSAAAAFGATNYLVAWESSSGYYQTYAALVSLSGSVSPAIQLNQNASVDLNNPAIAFDGANFLVAWNHDTTHNSSGQPIDWDVYGRFVSQGGTLPGGELHLVTDTGNQAYPALAFDGANYLLEWTDYPSASPTNSTLRGRFLTTSGAAAGPEFTLMTAQGTNQPFFAVGCVAFGGGRYAVAGTLGTLTVNVLGSVTGIGSAVIYGTILPGPGTPPLLTLGAQTNRTQVPMTLNGTPGVNYVIQSKTNWTATNWLSLVTNSPTNGPFTFIDTRATNTSKFYRAVKQ